MKINLGHGRGVLWSGAWFGQTSKDGHSDFLALSAPNFRKASRAIKSVATSNAANV
jgi:hypothetical protein